jgi:hypothetical protein
VTEAGSRRKGTSFRPSRLHDRARRAGSLARSLRHRTGKRATRQKEPESHGSPAAQGPSRARIRSKTTAVGGEGVRLRASRRHPLVSFAPFPACVLRCAPQGSGAFESRFPGKARLAINVTDRDAFRAHIDHTKHDREPKTARPDGAVRVSSHRSDHSLTVSPLRGSFCRAFRFSRPSLPTEGMWVDCVDVNRQPSMLMPQMAGKALAQPPGTMPFPTRERFAPSQRAPGAGCGSPANRPLRQS